MSEPASDEYESVKVGKPIMSLLKYHLLTNVLPELTDISKDEDQQEFREAVLETWVSDALKEKLEREMNGPLPDSAAPPTGRAVLSSNETHL